MFVGKIILCLIKIQRAHKSFSQLFSSVVFLLKGENSTRYKKFCFIYLFDLYAFVIAKGHIKHCCFFSLCTIYFKIFSEAIIHVNFFLEHTKNKKM